MKPLGVVPQHVCASHEAFVAVPQHVCVSREAIAVEPVVVSGLVQAPVAHGRVCERMRPGTRDSVGQQAMCSMLGRFGGGYFVIAELYSGVVAAADCGSSFYSSSQPPS